MVKSPEGKVDGLTKGGKDTKSKDAIKDLKNLKDQRSPEETVKSKNTRQHRLLKHGGKEMTLKKDWFVSIWITQVSRRISRRLAGISRQNCAKIGAEAIVQTKTQSSKST
jgi:hypothetical protein